MEMGKVSIVDTDVGIKSSLEKSIELIGGLSHFIEHDDTVMLKPNINGTSVVTNVELVDAFIQILKGYNVKKVVIAESTFGNEKMTQRCFEKTGYSNLANKHGIELINLNESEIVEIKVKKSLITNKLSIAKEVLEVNKIINLPIMKVHYATAITLCMKNLKGLLVRNEKRRFHEVGLDKAIVDLNNTIRPCLNIIDCTTCMEQMGPHGGKLINLNLLIAGSSCAEVDYIGSVVMGYTLDEVKHLKYYIEENEIDIRKIEIMGRKVKEVVHVFEKVEMSNAIPSNLKVYETNACSSCMNALLLSCQFLEENNKKIGADIYLGSGYNQHNSKKRLKIAFGNCCSADIEFDRVIKGCPPFPLKLKEELNK